MDSLKMADFLFTRIKETITYSQYIAEVRIGYEYDETFGNRYIRLHYTLDLNEAFGTLPLKEQERIFRADLIYTFSLATHNERRRITRKKEPLRIVEFRYIYESLTTYAYLQLREYLLPEIIKIKEIDFWPETNYTEQYLNTALKDSYFSIRHATLDNEVWQWKHLHKLAAQSRTFYRKRKQHFGITDIALCRLFALPLSDIRSLLVRYKIAIKVKGEKTIDEILIYIPSLVMALKKELHIECIGRYDKPIYKRMIIYLYDEYLFDEKAAIIQKQRSYFLQQLVIQQGDILELKDGRIVSADTIEMDVQEQVFITYSLIKNDLEPSQRSRTISINDIAYILKKDDFRHYVNQVVRRHLSLLKKWMQQRKSAIGKITFDPDLTISTNIDSL